MIKYILPECLEASQAPQHGGASGDVSRDIGTFSASDGRVDGRDAADIDRNRPREPSACRNIYTEDQRIHKGAEQHLSGNKESRPQSARSERTDGMEALRNRGVDRRGYSGARERFLALAGTAENRESDTARPASGGRAFETRTDRTATAIQRQITALGVERFEIGIRDQKTGQMINREWSCAEIEKNMPWLKRMNARGNNIYIRPAGAHGLVLVDDLKPEALERMKEKGFTPAAVIETSPDNYQIWVKLSEAPISADIRQLAARGFAQKFAGDMNSADSKHYGRLAGFTNQKPAYRHGGHQPYVRAHECSGKVASSATAYLERLGAHLDRVLSQKAQKVRLEAIKTARPPLYGARPIHEYQRQAQRLLGRYGADADLSRLDWMISTDMAKSGRFTPHDIEQAIQACSPNIQSRKAGHIEDYAKRTAEKAWHAPEVVAHREQQALEQKTARVRDRGQGFER